jgi:hypothetical protein
MGGGKNVRAGGALTLGGTALYALKGNNTLEYYRYGPLAAEQYQASSLKPQAQSSGLTGTGGLRLAVSPNPSGGATTVTYTLPQAGNHTLRLYDVSGKLVGTLASGYRSAGSYAAGVTRPGLVAGVYLLKLEAEAASLRAKLIVE